MLVAVRPFVYVLLNEKKNKKYAALPFSGFQPSYSIEINELL